MTVQEYLEDNDVLRIVTIYQNKKPVLVKMSATEILNIFTCLNSFKVYRLANANIRNLRNNCNGLEIYV